MTVIIKSPSDYTDSEFFISIQKAYLNSETNIDYLDDIPILNLMHEERVRIGILFKIL